MTNNCSNTPSEAEVQSAIALGFTQNIDPRIISGMAFLDTNGIDSAFVNPLTTSLDSLEMARQQIITNALALSSAIPPTDAPLDPLNPPANRTEELLWLMEPASQWESGGAYFGSGYAAPPSVYSSYGSGMPLNLFSALEGPFAGLPGGFDVGNPFTSGLVPSFGSLRGFSDNLIGNMPYYLGLSRSSSFIMESTRSQLSVSNPGLFSPYPNPCDLASGLFDLFSKGLQFLSQLLQKILGLISNIIDFILGPIIALVKQILDMISALIAALIQMLGLNKLFGLLSKLLGLLNDPCLRAILQTVMAPGLRGGMGVI